MAASLLLRSVAATVLVVAVAAAVDVAALSVNGFSLQSSSMVCDNRLSCIRTLLLFAPKAKGITERESDNKQPVDGVKRSTQNAKLPL